MTRSFSSVLIVLTIGAVTAAYSQDKTITVFAAASMKNALDDVDAAFTNKTGIKVVTSYDASSALMKQIDGGAQLTFERILVWPDGRREIEGVTPKQLPAPSHALPNPDPGSTEPSDNKDLDD